VSFPGVALDSVHDVRVLGPDGVAIVRGVRVGEGPVEVRLGPGETIRGTVEVPADVDSPRARAVLEGKSYWVKVRDGAFELKGLTPEVWTVYAYGRKTDGKRWSSGRVEVRAPGLVELK
jgi:hypothetical protein